MATSVLYRLELHPKVLAYLERPTHRHLLHDRDVTEEGSCVGEASCEDCTGPGATCAPTCPGCGGKD